MTLSRDCIDYRDRQQVRTQRWVLLGVLGAIGVHAGVIPMWRWWPSSAAQLAAEERIQLTVMPPPPEAIADQAGMADAPPPATATPTAIAAPSPPAVAGVSASSPPAIEATVASPVEPVKETPDAAVAPESASEKLEIEEPPELAEGIAETEIEEPEIEELEIDESNIDADDADVLAAAAEPPAAGQELDSTADVVAPEIATAPDVDATGVADALSRLLGNGNTPTVEATPTGNNSATTPAGIATDDVARSTGPDGPADEGAEATGDAAAPGNSGNDSPTVSCRQCGRPAYPTAALDAGIEGQPIVRAQFDSNGNVIAVTLERPSGNAALDQAALAAVRNWQFDTGGQSGSVPVEIPFVIEGSERHQAAQQQGDRKAATVRDEAPTAGSNPAEPPVQSAAEPLESGLDGINDPAADTESAAADDDANQDATAADTATQAEESEPVSSPEVVDESAPAEADDAVSPAAEEPEPTGNTAEPVPASPPPEPERPATEPTAAPAAPPEPVEDSEAASE